MKKNKSNFIICLLILAVIATWLFMRNSHNESGNGEKGINPTFRELVIKKEISGILYPEREISAKSSVSGTLEEYYVQVGDRVAKGDRIAKVKVITSASQIEEARASIENYRIQDEKLHRSYERSRILYDKGLIAACDYEASKTEYEANHSKFLTARNQLQILMGKGNLSNVVTAPCSGVISLLPLEPGTSVMEVSNYGEGTTVAQVSQDSRFLFKSNVVEADVTALRKGMRIPVTIASSRRTVTATLTRISTAGVRDNHNVMKYEIQALFTPPPGVTIFSGFAASASVVMRRKKALTLPCEYVTFSGDSAFVTVKGEDGRTRRNIQTGDTDGNYYEILKGADSKTTVYKP